MWSKGISDRWVCAIHDVGDHCQFAELEFWIINKEDFYMPNDRCPRCNSQAVYKMRNGIISGDKHVFVRGLSLLTPQTDRMTYLCADCGYYENHIIDKDILEGVRQKWDRA